MPIYVSNFVNTISSRVRVFAGDRANCIKVYLVHDRPNLQNKWGGMGRKKGESTNRSCLEPV